MEAAKSGEGAVGQRCKVGWGEVIDHGTVEGYEEFTETGGLETF